MEEIHSCGNQCKKLIIKDLMMQRMITHVRKFYNNKVFFFSFDNSLKLLTKVFFIFFFQSTRLELPLKHRKVIIKNRTFCFWLLNFSMHGDNINFIIIRHCDISIDFVYMYYIVISLCINIHFCVKLYLHAHVSKYWLVLRYWFSYSWWSTFIFICDIWLHMIERQMLLTNWIKFQCWII